MKERNVLRLCLLSFIGVFLFFLTLQSVTATITVTLPISEPLSPNATLQPGGSLTVNTTYYYVVFAYDRSTMTPISNTEFGYHSPVSVEGNFTTNDTYKSCLIRWTNPAEHTSTSRYIILLSNTSGDYSSALSTVGVASTETLTLITSGVTGYNITANPSYAYGYHSYQMKNMLPFNMNKSSGIIKVYVDNGTWSSSGIWTYKYFLEAVYQEIVSAGYNSSVYWDGTNFALKGWIIINGANNTTVNLRNVAVYFVKGGLFVDNPNANITFGYWVDDDYGGAYNYGVDIYLMNNRYPFKAVDAGTLNVYGSKIHMSVTDGMPLSVAEVNNFLYYTGGANLNLGQDIASFKDNIITKSAGIRSYTSEVKDLKIGIANNWANTDTYRLKLTDNAMFAYTTSARIYAPNWVISLTGSNGLRFYVPLSGANYSTYLYDPVFSKYPVNNYPDDFYFATNYGVLTSNSTLFVQHSLMLKVIDEDGNALEGVSVDMVDKNGNSALWIEHDGTFDRTVTGNEYTTARTTNSTGQIDYYVQSYKVTLNESNTIASSTCNNYNKTDYYPFTLTLSKEGYGNYSVILNKFTNKIDWTIKLGPPEEECVCDESFIGTCNNKITNIVKDGSTTEYYSCNKLLFSIKSL